LAALLGVLVAVLPAALAAPSTLKLEVVQNCHIAEWPCWNPQGNPETNVPENAVPPFKLAQGGTISFEDKDAKAPTDVIWKGAKPSCTGVVEAPPTKTGWSGTCTFSEPGIYKFESEGLFKETGYANIDYTKYEIIVEGSTTTTGTSGTTGTTTPTTTTPPPASSESPLAGPGSQAVKVAKSQHGRSVKGAIDLSMAAAGGRLEVDVFAQSASLAKAKHSSRVRVGRYVRSSLSAGKLSFSAKLNAKAQRALKRHHRLALTVEIVLTPASGKTLTITRSVVQHP
jgi:hypothetical protein